MKQFFLFILLIVFTFSYTTKAQENNKVHKYENIEVSKIKCAKYVYKRVWKKNAKNYSLFYPETTNTNYTNFIDLILKGVHTQGITAYDALPSDIGEEFDIIMIEKDIHTKMGASIEIEYVENNFGNFDTITVFYPYNSTEITSFLIQELWLYDYDNKLIQVQTLGIAPVREYYRQDDIEKENPIYTKVFWIFYPEIQQYAANQQIMQENGNANKTFDDFIFNRQYKSEEIKFDEEQNFFVNIQRFKIFDEPNAILYQEQEQEQEQKSLFEYKSIEDSEIMFAKYVYQRVWKKDSNNYSLFYPPYKNLGFISLIDLILEGISIKGIPSYNANFGDFGNEFDEIITTEEVYSQMGSKTETVFLETENGYKEISIEQPYNSQEITSYLILELELYDKNKKIIQTKTVGICPIRKFYRNYDIDMEFPLYKKTFWVYFPDIQKLCTNILAQKNDCSENKTFAQILSEQLYSSINMGDSIEDYQNLYVNINEKLSFNPISKITDITKNINSSEKEKINYQEMGFWDFKKAEIVYTKVNKEKNKELFFPLQKTLGYTSLIDLILYKVEKAGISCYKNSKLTKQLTIKEIHEIMGTTTETYNIEGSKPIVIDIPYNSAEISFYIFEELWLYDRKNNVIDKRIIAICPVREYYRNTDIEMSNPIYKKVFWIDYSSIQKDFQKQNLTKLSPKPDMTINEFFVKNKYSTEVIETNKISKWKARRILKK